MANSIVNKTNKLNALSKKVFIINGNGQAIDAIIPTTLALFTSVLMFAFTNSFSTDRVMLNTNTKCQIKLKKGINSNQTNPGLSERFSGEMRDNIFDKLRT